MKIITTEAKKEVKSLHESIFWDEGDPRFAMTGLGKESAGPEESQIVDLAHDAYIWVYTGPRGAGKTLAMTYYAAKAVYLYGMRLVSNYPIAFVLNKIDGTHTYIEAEPLDLYKLLCFDRDYSHCLILIDEAPDIISHMASMTWKNRLLNIFVRQVRKNMNSLFMGAQQFTLIDKSMRWQTDVVVKCQDAFRLYGASGGLARGACILLDLFDNSGQWTGHGKNISHDGELEYLDPDESLELPGKPIWGAFDTYHQQDIFESLKRVDMRLGTYEVGKPEEENSEYKERAVEIVGAIANNGKRIIRTEMYAAIGEGSQKDKAELGSALRKSGTTSGGNAKGDIFFDNFDMQKFLKTYLMGKRAGK